MLIYIYIEKKSLTPKILLWVHQQKFKDVHTCLEVRPKENKIG